MTIFGRAELLKTMKRLGLVRPAVTLFDGLFLREHERLRREILIQSLLKYSIYFIKIWN